MRKTPLIEDNPSCFINGHHIYKLIDPFRNIHFLPLGADTIAANLDLSYSSALRVCKGEKRLKKSEVLLLQIIHFGLIPDKNFISQRLYFYKGTLLCHNVRYLEMTSGELATLYLLKFEVVRLKEELQAARMLIKKLTDELNPPQPKPTNLIQFSDYFKSKG